MRILAFFGGWAFRAAYPLFAWYLSRSERTRVIVCHDNKVLLVKSWLSLGGWDLPGGGLHKNEDPLLGGLRELKEETGIIVDQQKVEMIGPHEFVSGKIRHVAHYMKVAMHEQPALTLQTREIAEAQWIGLKDLDTVELHSLHKQQIKAVLLTEV